MVETLTDTTVQTMSNESTNSYNVDIREIFINIY